MEEKVIPSKSDVAKRLPLKDKILYYIGVLRIEVAYCVDVGEVRCSLQYRKWHPLTILFFSCISVLFCVCAIWCAIWNSLLTLLEVLIRESIQAKEIVKNLFNFKTIYKLK